MHCLFFLLPFIGLPVLDHDFHVSKSQIEIIKQKEIRITMQIFLDDLEEALASNGFENLNICTPNESESSNIVLENYLSKHFSIHSDKGALDYTFLAKELGEDETSIWIFLSATFSPEVNTITIRNEVLIDMYPDQKNLVSIRKDGKSIGYFMLQKGASDKKVSL